MRMMGAAVLIAGSVLRMAAANTFAAPTHYDADAVRLNNRGVAQMGQQFTERAADTFASCGCRSGLPAGAAAAQRPESSSKANPAERSTAEMFMT